MPSAKFPAPLLSIAVLLAINVTFIFTASGQNPDFDSDSIYYTPIARTPPATVERNVSVFRDTTRKNDLVGYYFDVGMGMQVGCRDCATGTEFTFATSTTHGITLGRKTRVGLGVGLNTYVGWRTLPMFGSVSYDLAGTKNTHALFVQGHYGWSFAWRETLPYEVPPKEVQGGVMWAALVGYRVRYHNLRISISTGFRQQIVSSMFETETWIPSETGMMARGTPSRTTVQTTMGRGVLNLAFSWK